jgi:exopolysaccharide biosynthesis polyprenyl glycosylphosphotransferase
MERIVPSYPISSDAAGRHARLADIRVLPSMAQPQAGPPQGARTILRAIAVGQAVTDMIVALAVGRFALGGRTGVNSLALLLLVPFVWLAVFFALGLYAPTKLPAWDEFRRTIEAATVAILIIVTADLWLSSPGISGSGLAVSWLAAVILALLARKAWRWIGWQLKKRGVLVERTLIVGTGPEAAGIDASLSRIPMGFAPVGHVAISEEAASGREGSPSAVQEIRDLIEERRVDCVFVASGEATRQTLLDVSSACRQANVDLRVSANVPDIMPSRMLVDSVADVVTIAIQPPRLTGFRAALKRIFDVALASVALVLSAPLMLAASVLILATSGRPVFFHQDRVTKDLKIFRLHKFRTMVPDADEAADEVKPHLATPFFKMGDDPRITKVGRVLRRFSIDEFPQWWNVIRGDMSLVGPRPLWVEQVTDNEELGARHEVKAGLTGWWQISGRSDVSWVEAVKMDAFYIQNWSLGLDVYILLKTVPTLIRAKGAY